MAEKTPKTKCLVTVGSTKFDELIEQVLSEPTMKRLHELGIRDLFIQCGAGAIYDNVEGRGGWMSSEAHGEQGLECAHASGVTVSCVYYNMERRLQIRMVRYLPSLQSQIQWADLIIGHAGAGTCMEALAAHKPMVAVINPKLMDNHQSELAQKLASNGHLVMVESPDLINKSLNRTVFHPQPFPPPVNPKVFVHEVERIMNS